MLKSVFDNRRRLLVIIHDLVATAAALLASFYLRFEEAGLNERLGGLKIALPCLLVYAMVVYWYFDLYRAKWRFASLPDLANILRASTVLAVSLLVVDYILVSPNVLGEFFFGKLTIVLYWVLQMFFLGGPRIAYRYFRYARIRQHAIGASSTPIIILGRAADAEVLLRAVEAGRGQAYLAGRHPVALAGGPGPDHARHFRARRFRPARARYRRAEGSRHRGAPLGAYRLRLRKGQ